MSALARRQRRYAAAFWLLVAAWACANVRPGAAGTFLSWLTDATRFSHQQRLSLKVAGLLGGDKQAPQVAKSEPAPKPPPKTPVVPESIFKKLEVPLLRSTQLGVVAGTPVIFWPCPARIAGQERAAPPHGPPRTATVS